MSDRLPSAILVSSLLRRVNDSGGFAVVRAKGDAQAGAILFVLEEDGGDRIVERGIGADGRSGLIETGPRSGSGESVDDYWRRRRGRDPDLWVVALAVPGAERFVAETIG
jgi:hypothetical protein